MSNKNCKKGSTIDSTNEYTLKLARMPEIEFIDPVTGMLPKNVKELIKAKRDIKSGTTNAIIEVGESENKHFGLELRRMPEIALINPITGLLPKNYKEILAQNKASSLSKFRSEPSNCSHSIENMKLENKTNQNHNSKSKKLEFDISKVQTSKPRLSRSGCTNYESKGARKVLFKNISQSSKDGVLQKQKPRYTNTDESGILNMEESEDEILVPKKKPKSLATHLVKSRVTLVQRKPNPKKKNLRLSSSSLEEFSRLEEQMKTPKSIIKQKSTQQDFKLLNHINGIKRKLNENEKLFEEFKTIINKVETNNKEVNDILNKILNYTTDDQKETFCAIDENMSPNIMPNNCSVTKNLRVETLQKNLEKKVIFDLNGSGVCGNGTENQETTSKMVVPQTPNTMFRNVCKKANEQLSKLADTPKSAFNRFA